MNFSDFSKFFWGFFFFDFSWIFLNFSDFSKFFFGVRRFYKWKRIQTLNLIIWNPQKKSLDFSDFLGGVYEDFFEWTTPRAFRHYTQLGQFFVPLLRDVEFPLRNDGLRPTNWLQSITRRSFFQRQNSSPERCNGQAGDNSTPARSSLQNRWTGPSFQTQLLRSDNKSKPSLVDCTGARSSICNCQPALTKLEWSSHLFGGRPRHADPHSSSPHAPVIHPSWTLASVPLSAPLHETTTSATRCNQTRPLRSTKEILVSPFHISIPTHPHNATSAHFGSTTIFQNILNQMQMLCGTV